MSGGKAEAELISVNRPVLPSSANVVTVPSNSLSTYTNLLSAEVTKWRGPVDCFRSTSGGVFELMQHGHVTGNNLGLAASFDDRLSGFLK